MKIQMLFLTALVLCFSSVSYADPVRDACSQLVIDYAYHRDRFNAEEFAALFTEDGVLTIGENTWSGRDAIRGRIEGINDGSSIRHLMSTIRITREDEDHATGVSYVQIYSAPVGENRVRGFTLVGEYHDRFVRTAQGWKIANRSLETIYTQQPE